MYIKDNVIEYYFYGGTKDDHAFRIYSDSSSQFYDTVTAPKFKGYLEGVSEDSNKLGGKESSYYASLSELNNKFTKNNIKSTLGISDWALASVKPTYTASEVGALAVDGAFTEELLGDLNNATALRFFTMQINLGSTDGNKPDVSHPAGFTGQFAKNDDYRWQLAATSNQRFFCRFETNNEWSDWIKFAFTSDIPTKLSQLTDDVVSGKYLPLSGGEVNGPVTFVANHYIRIKPYSATSNGGGWANKGLMFIDENNDILGGVGAHGNNNKMSYIYIGSEAYNGANLRVGNGILNWGDYPILHSGNYADYALPLSGGTLTGMLRINTSSAAYVQYQQNATIKAEVGWHSMYGVFMKNETSDKFLHITDGGVPKFDGNILLHSGNYADYALPITGGTVNGNLNIGGPDNNNYYYLKFRRYNHALRINNNDVGGFIVFGDNTNDSFTAEKILQIGDSGLRYSSDGGSTYNNIIHTGNIGEQYVKGFVEVGSNANGRYDANELTSGGIMVNGSTFAAWDNAPTNPNVGSIIHFSPGGKQLYSLQMYVDGYFNKIAVRNYTANQTWNDWKQLAFTDSNVASATKLATPRTIWGQNFDGTGNVSGDISLSQGKIYWRNNVNSYYIGSSYTLSDGAPNLDYAGFSGHRFVVGVNSTAMVIDASGNVGIGTIEPTAKLYVKGDIYSTDGTNAIKLDGGSINLDINSTSFVARGLNASYSGTSFGNLSGIFLEDHVLQYFYYGGGYEINTHAMRLYGASDNYKAVFTGNIETTGHISAGSVNDYDSRLNILEGIIGETGADGGLVSKLEELIEFIENSDLESMQALLEGKADKATTLAGYGITDAYTKAEADGKYFPKGGGTINGRLVIGDVTTFNRDVEFKYGQAAFSTYLSNKTETSLFLQVNPNDNLLLGQGIAQNGGSTNIYGYKINFGYGLSGSMSNLSMAIQETGDVYLYKKLKITNGSDVKLILNNTDADEKYQFISFNQNDVEYGQLGTRGGDDLVWGKSGYWDILLHSGNLSSFKLSQFTDDVVGGKYLPLSGGTLTNTGTILGINRTDGNPMIGFNNNGNRLGWLGFNTAYEPIAQVSENGSFAVRKILHSGNLSSFKLSQFTDDVVAGKYLQLSGGTITSNQIASLMLESTDSRGHSLLQFSNNGVYLGALGFSDVDTPYFRTTGGVVRYLLHSRNYSDLLANGTINGSITATSFIGDLQGNADSSNVTKGFRRIIINYNTVGDLNTILKDGGIANNYYASSAWVNGPSGASYGSCIQFQSDPTEDELAGQLF